MGEKKDQMPFTRENYLLMLGGIALLVIGYLVMSADKTEFGFGFMGLTFGPILVFLAFMVPFVAIFFNKKKSKNQRDEMAMKKEAEKTNR
ncbi:DUF3098 domain-containing protein [Microscilla marina]|uniref:DUF3098 domain-containing protein n=1 Tax=Microscilla marina ATCC 23134 TaxID=313606 RepID=A1ZFF6_MICM2|nr:DUF3098 domain-containing protein [Microscilla marina]EAY30730.1 hypothetical protein M23134_01054 [Microscilla marina ATCC 23134]